MSYAPEESVIFTVIVSIVSGVNVIALKCKVSALLPVSAVTLTKSVSRIVIAMIGSGFAASESKIFAEVKISVVSYPILIITESDDNVKIGVSFVFPKFILCKNWTVSPSPSVNLILKSKVSGGA